MLLVLLLVTGRLVAAADEVGVGGDVVVPVAGSVRGVDDAGVGADSRFFFLTFSISSSGRDSRLLLDSASAAAAAASLFSVLGGKSGLLVLLLLLMLVVDV